MKNSFFHLGKLQAQLQLNRLERKSKTKKIQQSIRHEVHWRKSIARTIKKHRQYETDVDINNNTDNIVIEIPSSYHRTDSNSHCIWAVYICLGKYSHTIMPFHVKRHVTLSTRPFYASATAMTELAIR